MAFHTHSDVASQNKKRRGHVRPCCQLICVVLLAFSLFFIGVAAGVLIGKLVFDKDDKNGGQTSSTNWGRMVTQDGVQKPVLEAIVDMMKAENIKENLRYKS